MSWRLSVGKRIAGLVLAAAVVWFGGRDYMGFRHFIRYEKERAAARSIESAFRTLAVEIEAAAGASGNPAYFLAAGRLYLERALAENEFGSPARRDEFASGADALLAEAIRRSPADADGYYELGKVHMLFNFPLLTYGGTSRSFFRRAVELKPADEFLAGNVVYVFLAQWEALTAGERSFASEKLRAMAEMPPRVLARLKAMWSKAFGSLERLNELARAAGVDLTRF